MVARLDYVMESKHTPSELRPIYDDIVKLRGGLLNLYRILANQPPALRAFMRMSRYIRDESSLQPQLRELVILVTAYALKVEYERHHHLAAARKVGVAEAKLRAIASWRTSGAFEPAERAAMAYAAQVANSRVDDSTFRDLLRYFSPREVDDSTFRDLLRYFSPREVIDLAVTVAWYHFCAALIVPLNVELETSSPQ